MISFILFRFNFLGLSKRHGTKPPSSPTAQKYPTKPRPRSAIPRLGEPADQLFRLQHTVFSPEIYPIHFLHSCIVPFVQQPPPSLRDRYFTPPYILICLLLPVPSSATIAACSICIDNFLPRIPTCLSVTTEADNIRFYGYTAPLQTTISFSLSPPLLQPILRVGAGDPFLSFHSLPRFPGVLHT